MNRERSTSGLDGVIAKLQKYHKESLTDIRSNNIWRGIRSYQSLEEAKKELNQGLLIYKSVFLDKKPLQDKNLYQLFEKTIDDKSALHPMEEVDIKTQYNYGIDGTPSKKFREKTVSYLKQYCEDIILSNLLYDEKPRQINEQEEINKIKMITGLLEDGNHRNFYKLGRTLDRKVLPSYIIAKTFSDRSPFLFYFRFEDIENARKMFYKLFRSIEDPEIRTAVMKRFSALKAPKVNSLETKKPNVSLNESADYDEIQKEKKRIIGKIKEKVLPDNYEMEKTFFSLTPFFYVKDYEVIAKKTLKKLFGKELTDGEKKKMALSLRDTYRDITSHKETLKKPIDKAFERQLQSSDNFLQLDKAILQTMFDKYKKLRGKKVEYYDFLRLSGTLMAVKSLRKAYLLSKLKTTMKENDGALTIIPDDISISNNINVLREMFGETKYQLFDSKYTDQMMDLLNDDDIVSHWVFFTLNNQIKIHEKGFKKRKIIKTRDELELDLSPNFLFPKKDNYLQTGNLQIPIESKLTDDGKDHYYVHIHSSNRLVTIIPMSDKIRNVRF
ncbi:MAG: hypothetical protein AAB441_00145 [Patescibacteria group bacterium]